jgi:tetratricopeptide (TPR) repeat protein
MVGLFFFAGCRTVPAPAGSVEPETPVPGLSAAEVELANALANFAMGVLRDGLADTNALANYERARQLSPGRLDLYYRVAAVRLRLGQSAAAIAELEEACRKHPQDTEPRLYLAQIHQALKQWDAARDAWLDAIRVAPRDHDAYLQLALMYRERGFETRAVDLLEAALAKVNDQRPVLRLLGDIYLQRAGNVTPGKITPDLQKAIDYYQRASLKPSDELTLPYLMQLGDMYLLTRQLDSAIGCFTAVLAKDPDNLLAQKKLALCFLAKNDKEKSIQYLKAIAEIEPLNTEVQYYLGELYENLADPANAAARFTLACAGTPSNSKVFIKLAFLYMQTNPRRAGEVLEFGLEKFPADQQLLEMLIHLYLTNNWKDEAAYALDRWQEIVSRDPDRAQAARRLLHYGIMAQQNRLADNAAALYLQAVTLDPKLVEAYIYLAFIALNDKREAEALRVMEFAQRSVPNDFSVNFVFGVLYGRMQRYAEAAAALEKARIAALADPEDALKLDSAFYLQYGAVCERSGDFKRAETMLQRAIDLDPGNSDALNALAYMWSERGV